ncbi:CHD5-like protein-domain-containing protein [Auriculariales sp. MPI-PUGE-AT-0066]|nr:CHD5-like protein-domain-containing protein [Auriculariales sp. MPI-PUGE-AT-0066]
MALALFIFLAVLSTQIVSWVGASVLNDAACWVYLSIFQGAIMSQQRTLKSEILLNKAELQRTSAQEQFAKWAKLRRRVDKGLEDLDKLNKSLVSTKASFAAGFRPFLWILTSGVQLIVGWWYGRQAVFFVPASVLGPLTWWLSFPFAPAGSVSCMIWQFACGRVIKIVERLVRDALTAYQRKPVPAVAVEEVTESKKEQ